MAMVLGTQDIQAQAAPVEQLLFTLDDVARITRISRPHLEREIARGNFPSLKIGRLRRVSKAQLLAYIERLERGGDVA